MLDIKAVTKTLFRRTVNERAALSSTSLYLNPGNFVTITGSNDAGKSTLLNIVSGRCQADVRRVKIEGEDVAKLPDYKVTKYASRIFQDPVADTILHLPTEENFTFIQSRGRGCTLGFALTQKKRQMLRDILASLKRGLENRLHMRVGLLSGGQCQTLSLTVATFSEPRVLLLDEHIVVLDPKRATFIIQIAREVVKRQHLTILMVTYSMERTSSAGNRLIMTHEGRIIFKLASEKEKRATVISPLAEFDKLRGKKGQGLSGRMLLA